MRTRPTHMALLRSLAAASLIALVWPSLANAMSVQGVTQNALQLNTLGTPYIHSRHAGLMPYWGPCYRCQTVTTSYCTAANNNSNLMTYSGQGNSFTVSDTNCNWSLVLNNGQWAGYYDSTLSWNNTTGTFSGSLNFTGASEIQVICGGNSGIAGSGSSIVPDNLPIGSGGCNPGNQTATGNPITLQNGDFVGGPITIGNVWGNWTVAAAGTCLAVSYNGASEGDLCAFTNTTKQVCHHYLPTSTTCKRPANELGSVTAWPCNTQTTWPNSQACATGGGASWIWGSPDGASGTNASGYYVMETQYNNQTGSPINASLVFSADNNGWVWINGQQVGFGDNWTVNTTAAVQLPVGTDTIDFMVMNTPDPYAGSSEISPAAGVLSISQGGQILVTTNSNWWFVNAPPATPSPTPQSLLSASPGYAPFNCAAGGC
ncbi:hypothetical protein HAP94_07180 [Acidithiobacillus ferrivorans]|nr:hypothetical protein [Acidithiobacillus ferrivorans]